VFEFYFVKYYILARSMHFHGKLFATKRDVYLEKNSLFKLESVKNRKMKS